MVYAKPSRKSGALTILLADDDPMVRDTGRELLEAMGYRVATAATGDETLQVFSRLRKVDLVVLDYNMPGENSLTVLQKLKTLKPGVQVLITSGYFPSPAIAMLRKSGASGLLHKPYRISALGPFIHQALKGKKTL
ncbi:MAG: response regulator [Deltaproteobacteria bacterium]|nr:response regulator [Deltaproteobacteria bacterium]